MLDGINQRLQRMLAGDHADSSNKRVILHSNREIARQRNSNSYEESMREVDAELLQVVEAELMGDRVDSDDDGGSARGEARAVHEKSALEIDEEVLRAV